MDARGLIWKLRKGKALTQEEAYWIGKSIDGPQFADAQVGAFAMGVCLNELGADARVALTKGMRDSGDVLTWDLPGPVMDKHSTGGVGDPVSLLLAPALAACGAFVPMISGRGLGHTGGTLDKLEAIPGYVCEVGSSRLHHIVKTVGCAIVGASGRVAPSDKRLYAVRDVTGTVESIDLITASILSKKLAAGLHGLVLDVKTGSGAFMENIDDARKLATSLVEVANGMGCKTSALITDMSQPLADAAGNALEIVAVMETLTQSRVNERLQHVTCALGAEVLLSSGLCDDIEDGKVKLEAVLTSGRAAEVFSALVSASGGPMDFAQSWRNCLPEAPVLREVTVDKTGILTSMDTRILGEAVVALGGGRMREHDKLDYSVGLSRILPISTKIDAKTPIAMVHARSEDDADKAVARVRSAVQVSVSEATPIGPVLEKID
ncbi:MAG: thymidine phosphorylase [Litoreibacter sp.]